MLPSCPICIYAAMKLALYLDECYVWALRHEQSFTEEANHTNRSKHYRHFIAMLEITHVLNACHVNPEWVHYENASISSNDNFDIYHVN
ncbi:hypothetical protein X798_00853 [Onchocerca flexuosa]|uniref:Uncharacterized protein n=1 Tax=Onchocerca flexuosa TaxID=387005 RepID=A0A238C4D6_9BILA|nr:hypothetical protein X798_00853 [Onchocerca flexuosa]